MEREMPRIDELIYTYWICKTDYDVMRRKKNKKQRFIRLIMKYNFWTYFVFDDNELIFETHLLYFLFLIMIFFKFVI